jgi:hypothetical protein
MHLVFRNSEQCHEPRHNVKQFPFPEANFITLPPPGISWPPGVKLAPRGEV